MERITSAQLQRKGEDYERRDGNGLVFHTCLWCCAVAFMESKKMSETIKAITAHLLQLAPHQAERETSTLLRNARDELSASQAREAELRERLETLEANAQDEINRLNAQILDRDTKMEAAEALNSLQAQSIDRLSKELEHTIADLRTRLSGQTHYVPPEFQNQLDAANRTIAELEQREMVLTDAVIMAEKYLAERVSNSGTIGRTVVLPALREALNQTPQQSADQVLRWHVEWMRQQPVFGVWHQGDTDAESDFFLGDAVDADDCAHCTALFEIPPLPKDSKP